MRTNADRVREYAPYIAPATDPILVHSEKRSNSIPPEKIIVFLFFFAALIAATVFTGGLAAAAVGAGANAMWSGFLIGAAAACGLSAIASPFTAIYCDMFTDTHTNGTDILWFMGITTFFSLWAVGKLGYEGLKTGALIECIKALSKPKS